jgi:hypothetical protein
VLEPQKKTSASSEPLGESKSDDFSHVILLVNNLRRKKPAIFRHIMGIIKAILKE